MERGFYAELGGLKYNGRRWDKDGTIIYREKCASMEEVEVAFHGLNPREIFEKECGVRGGIHRMKNKGYYAEWYFVLSDDTVESYGWSKWTQEDACCWYVHEEGFYEIVMPFMQSDLAPEPAYIADADEFEKLVQQARELGASGIRWCEDYEIENR